jgi:hypothetical protein
MSTSERVTTPEPAYFTRCTSCRRAKNRTPNPICSGCQREGERERGRTARERAGAKRKAKELATPPVILALPEDERAAALAILNRLAPSTPYTLYYAAREAVSDVRRALECEGGCCQGMSRERRLELVLE